MTTIWAKVRFYICFAAPLLVAVMISGAPATAIEPKGVVGEQFFRERIEPVLVKECYGCHSASAKDVKAGLRLDSRAALLRGGDSGPAIVPGNTDEGTLIPALRHEDGMAMPPKKPKLAATTIDNFVTWIKGGAPDPRESAEGASEGSTQPDVRRHWAFQPVGTTPLPQVRDRSWIRTPIDAFVLAKLEQRGWSPSPEASRAAWLRRVRFDLTGLPPTPEELDAFERDRSDTAYERVVDRLLASPEYGERWGMHWLDVVRYAETEGYEYDQAVPGAWRFRDYVVRSFNNDKPFDRFVTEQIAGDEIAPNDSECQTASTFHRLGPVRRNAGNPEIALSRNEVLTERTDIIGTAFLGLTVGCARCHNHKLEPISQKDYYRLQAFLAATDEHNISLASAPEVEAWKSRVKAIENEKKRLQSKARKSTGAERNRLSEQIEALDERLPAPLPTIPATRNLASARTPIHVLKRGVWENKAERVGPRPLSVLVTDSTPELLPDVADPRTQLARWITSPENPLTPRVIVNRVWLNHFGTGLVKTANDFGTKGERPSHPELLNWLARSLIDNGWRLKPLHRLIVLSATYRQSSHVAGSTESVKADPEDRLLWHFPRRRLTAEEIRDAMLAVSGRLNPRAGGPSVMVPVEPELVNLLYKPKQWQVATDSKEHDRRSVYLIAKRNLRLPFLEVFDSPTLMISCARRESSTHAPQALEMLNGRLANDLAASFARRLTHDCNGEPERLVERAYLLALGRQPTPRERELSLGFVLNMPLEEFALAVFNLNGFLYVE